MDESGIEKVVLVPGMYKDGMGVNVNLPVRLVETKLSVLMVDYLMRNRMFRKRFITLPENDLVLKATRQHPERFYGMYWVNPNFISEIEKLELCLNGGYFIGIKLHQIIHPFELSDSNVQKVLWLADKYSLPLFIHPADMSPKG